VPLERRGVRTHFVGQVFGRGGHPLVAPRLRPAIERVEGRGIGHVGVRRGGAGARERALASPQLRLSTLVGELGAAAEDGQFQLEPLRAVQQRDAVLAGLRDVCPAVLTVDAIGDRPLRAGDRQADAPFEEPHELVGLQVDGGVVIEMERAAVGEEDLDAAATGADAIARQQRHVAGGVVGLAVAFENRDAVHQRDVRGSLGIGCRRILCVRGAGADQREHTASEEVKRPERTVWANHGDLGREP
jgi:hypothetical protein